MRLAVIGNPAAGGGAARGAAAKLAPSLQHLGLNPAQVLRWTRAPGDERRLVQQALHEGASTIGALGGDGTISLVGAAIVEANSTARLLPLPAGTGNDFVKSLAAPTHDHSAMLRLAADGAARAIDVGMVDDAPFLNVAGFGFDADVVAATAGARRLSGSALYAVTALRRLHAYRAAPLSVDGAPVRRRVLAAFANGRAFGGAFRIAPSAELDDGLLNAVLVDDVPLLRRIRVLAAVMRGAHLQQSGVTHTPGSSFSLSFDGPVVYQADGELRETRGSEVGVSIRPRALRVVTPG
jgi:diacylglycerol kinase (ATP)